MMHLTDTEITVPVHFMLIIILGSLFFIFFIRFSFITSLTGIVFFKFCTVNIIKELFGHYKKTGV